MRDGIPEHLPDWFLDPPEIGGLAREGGAANKVLQSIVDASKDCYYHGVQVHHAPPWGIGYSQ